MTDRNSTNHNQPVSLHWCSQLPRTGSNQDTSRDSLQLQAPSNDKFTQEIPERKEESVAPTLPTPTGMCLFYTLTIWKLCCAFWNSKCYAELICMQSQKVVLKHSHGVFKSKREPKWLNLVTKKLKWCSIFSKTSLWLLIWKWLGSQCSITQLRGGSQMPIQDHFTSDWEIVTWETKRGKGKEQTAQRERRRWRTSGGADFKLKPIEGEMVGTSFRGHTHLLTVPGGWYIQMQEAQS